MEKDSQLENFVQEVYSSVLRMVCVRREGLRIGQREGWILLQWYQRPQPILQDTLELR